MASVLLVRLSAMGDLVQSLGAVASLHEARPDWRLTFVTQASWAPLLTGIAGIARVVTFDRRGGLKALRAVRGELRQERYDWALDLQGNWKSALITRLSGARERLGMAARWRQEPWSRVLLHRTVACPAVPHPARAAWELVKQVAPTARFSLPRLEAGDDEIRFERERLERVGIDPGRAFRVVVGADPADSRALRGEWLLRLTSGAPSVLLNGPEERGLGVDGRRRVLQHERGEMRRLIALGNVVRDVGGEVIGPDKGATHVLLAAGARGRVLFGSQDPSRSSPPTATALIGPVAMSCRPCRKVHCPLASGRYACMDFDPDEGVAVELGLPVVGVADEL